MEVAGKVINTAEKGQTSNEQLFCKPCKADGDRNNAIGTCKECEEYMCDMCFRYHKKAKSCRNHRLVEIDKKPTDRRQAKTSEHWNYELGSIKNEADSDEIINQMFEKLASIEKKSKEKLAKNEREIDELNKKALDANQRFRSDLDDYLDNAEASVRSDIEKLTNENLELHKELEQDVRSLIKEVEEIQNKFTWNHASKTVDFIQTVTCKPKIENIRRMYDQIRQRNSLKMFEFSRSEKLAEILKSSPSLGKCFYPDFAEGTRVRRGLDWDWENEDEGGAGTVDYIERNGRAWVTWDTSRNGMYRKSQEKAFDLLNI